MLNRRTRFVFLVQERTELSLELLSVAARMRENDLRIATHWISRPDLPAVTLQASDTSFRAWIAAANAALDRLEGASNEINVVGVGLGATRALAIAAERSDAIDSLTIVSLPLFRDDWNVAGRSRVLPAFYYAQLGRLVRIRDRLLYGIKNDVHRQSTVKQNAAGDLHTRGSGYSTEAWLRDVNCLAGHARRSLHRSGSPTLMVHAREDDIASRSCVQFVRKHLGSDILSVLNVANNYPLVLEDTNDSHAVSKIIQFINTQAALRASVNSLPP